MNITDQLEILVGIVETYIDPGLYFIKVDYGTAKSPTYGEITGWVIMAANLYGPRRGHGIQMIIPWNESIVRLACDHLLKRINQEETTHVTKH